ncbi:MAG: IPT/TIG domain-containing protein, partial [Actinomycetota bacterium]|nr:IPT/TIG domain-containing protein [Actinomycetota bacterium]
MLLLLFGLTLGAGAPPAAALGVSVDAVLPALGATIGGTPVAVTGSGFQAGATVTIGGALASDVVVLSPTTIVATTPAGASGPATVTVTNPDSQSDSLLNGYLYTNLVPTVVSLSPGSILAGTPGATVTLGGTNFTADAEVLLNGQPRATTYVSPNEVRAELPPGDLAAPGSATLTVRNTLGTSNGATLMVTVPLAPVVAAVAPDQIVVGTPAATVRVLGANFMPGAQVLLNGQPRATTYV